MKKFRERNPLIMAAVSAVIFILGGFLALDFDDLPLISSTANHTAYFSTAVGLQTGDVVTIAGVRVGKVKTIALAGSRVKVTFTTGKGDHLGSRTRVNTKVINPVGVEYLEIVPAGPGSLHGTVPLSRTTVPGTLISDLNQFTEQTERTNIPQLVKSLDVVSNTLASPDPADTRAAITGVAQLSAILARKSSTITNLITQTNQLTALLNTHSGALVDLVGQANSVLGVLQEREGAVKSLLQTTSSLSVELNHLVTGTDAANTRGLLASLASVSRYLGAESGNLEDAIPQLAAFSRYAANALGSGPFGDFVAPTLVLPDNLLKQCSSVGALNPLLGCRT